MVVVYLLGGLAEYKEMVILLQKLEMGLNHNLLLPACAIMNKALFHNSQSLT